MRRSFRAKRHSVRLSIPWVEVGVATMMNVAGADIVQMSKHIPRRGLSFQSVGILSPSSYSILMLLRHSQWARLAVLDRVVSRLQLSDGLKLTQVVARMEIRTLTARLLLSYHVALAPGENGHRLLTKTLDQFTLSPGELKLTFTPLTSE